MNKKKSSLVREVLRYEPKRAYFDKFTTENLSVAYGQFKHTQSWDKPVLRTTVRVGKVDGGVICRALWNEMSYNPLRFGNVSPFIHNGTENIYHFCRCGVPEDSPCYKVMEKVRYELIDFMALNGRAKNQWYDNIDTENGMVVLTFVDGHSDDKYKMLSKLREAIKLITRQNVEDFKDKAHYAEMLKVIYVRHPNGIRKAKDAIVKQQYGLPKEITPEEELKEDRLDKAEESAQITLDNGSYVPTEQYEQALEYMNSMKNTKTKVLSR